MVLAARGSRNPDTGVEPVDDPDEQRTLRRQARLVYIQTTAASLIPTALGLVIPA
ncbi:hypothetical protein HN371_06120 [Candidatus Poribacteria bacterium]|nr:hypothetical protein [Candidatus Poribacteria bacterium]MBT5710643.1 hypothetical protein [Candidatus Poribacteria bacterium]MBT7099681.1 hypothetical protein [Candidatus Poribacteria bacterium]MBT7805390.1 hypothetical protein [Candidatus Poribacteria bacterium]